MSYTGYIAEIPLGDRGLVAPVIAIQAPEGALLEATNITYQRGAIQKEMGSKKYNTTPISGSPRILAGYDWWADQLTRRVVVYASNGSVYLDQFGVGSFSTVVGSGLSTLAETPIWLEAGQETAGSPKKLILVNGVDAPRYINGTNTTFSSFTSVPADWAANVQPVTATIHEGRAWYALKHTVYYSTTTDHTDVNGAGSGVFVVFPGEGREIRALVSFKGLLIVFKHPIGVYAIDTSSPSPSDWTVSRITGAVGISGPKAVTVLDNDLLWMDAAGDLYLLSAVQSFGEVAPRAISRETKIRDVLLSKFNYNRVHTVQLLYDPQWYQVHTAWALFGSTTQHGRFIIDLSQQDRFRFRTCDRDNLISLWIGRSASGVPTIYGGDPSGTVWWINDPEYAYHDQPYTSSAQIAPTDFRFIDPTIAAKRKNGDFLELVADANESYSAYVDVIWDNRVVQTVLYTFGSGGSALGSFTLGIDPLAGFGGKSVKRRIVGSGTTFAFRIRNGLAYQNFSLVRAFVYFRVADERKT